MKDEQAFPIEGDWWLPGSSDKTVAGRLEYSEERGADLTLLGSFNSGVRGPHLVPRPVILGRAHGMRQVTLLNCHGTGSYSGLGGKVDKETYRANVVFLGQHYDREDAILFKDVYADMTYLSTWADLRAIKYSHEETADIVRVERLPVRELMATDKYSVQLFASLASKPDWYSSTVTQSTRLVFSFKEPTSLSEYWPLLRDAQNLLTLLVGEPVFPSNISGVTPDEERRSVTIFRRVAFQRPAKNLHYLELLLPLDKMGPRSAELIRNWFQKAELLRPIHNLALGSLYNESVYAENRFLSIVQALESYHRRIKGGNDLPAAEHDARLTAILNAVPQEHKGWVRWKLGHSNEPNLEKRLASLSSQFPKFEKFLSARAEGFVSRVVKTRHYLTHFDEAKREGSFAASELYFPSEKLRMLFLMCMLTELGYSNEEAESILMRSNYFGMLMQYN